jgi:NAD(P)-dependent dehydrogenase (short-subunit alcohol dehydrogenase family)
MNEEGYIMNIAVIFAGGTGQRMNTASKPKQFLELHGKPIFVTGGTGLIGTSLINALLYADRELKLGLKVLALVRSVTRARTLFAAQLREGVPLRFVEGTVEQSPPIDGAIDYIVHGANPTASVFFVEHPVETIRIAVDGTLRMLELARTRINVRIPTDGKHENKFPPPHLLNLGTEKLAALGWRPTRGLREMYQRMMETM